MFASTDENSNLKLIDFGMSKSYYLIDGKKGSIQHERMKTKVGTVYFMAPEVFQDDYNQSCDMWSIGIILYLMLGGYPPFDGDTQEEIIESIKNQKYTFDGEMWSNVSPEGKDLIRSLLVHEDERLSPKE